VSRRGLALFALLSVLWGVPYLLIKVAVAEVSVPFLVFARSALGAAILLPFAFSGPGFATVKTHWRPVLAFALVEMVVPWGLIVHGEVRLSSSMAGLLVAATPIITVALGRLRDVSEPLGTSRLVGLLLGLGGVATLAAPEMSGDVLSVLEVLLAAGCYAVGSMIAALWLGNVAAIPMTAACLAMAAAAYLAPAVSHWPATWPSRQGGVAIVALGVACTAIAFACFFVLIREVGSERAVVITYVAPAVAVASGVALLGEPLDARIIVAFALILCGSWLATARVRPPPEGSGRSMTKGISDGM
jgi:drug/metabolite transporter (DMT)-like permease